MRQKSFFTFVHISVESMSAMGVFEGAQVLL